MRKIIMTLGLVMASTAAAQTNNIDCSSLRVNSYYDLSYNIPATFPNPTKKVETKLNNGFRFEDCGYTITSDGNMITIKGVDLDSVWRLVAAKGSTIPSFYFAFLVTSGFKYPSIYEGFYFYANYFIFNYTTGQIRTMTDADAAVSASLHQASAAGYKVDGGKMTPFYYEGKYIPANINVNFKTLDFYVLVSPSSTTVTESMQRVLIDKDNATITIWKKHPFPIN